jgi:two-component system response regulator AtoC
MSASVLVVDDEAVFRVLVEEALVSEGFEVRTADSLRRARSEIDIAAPDVLILDRRLPDGDGIDFLKTLATEGPTGTVVVVVTAYGDVENAVEALRAGAWDYLAKPVQLTDLLIKLRKVLETRGLKDRLVLAMTSAAGPPTVSARSPAMREMAEKLRRVSQSPFTPVFMRGPSGVGKQRAAETLHELSWPAEPGAPFVEVNCAALPDDLVESELFGHEKGAFTDARSTRRGVIEMAAGGTLFLDEITELPLRSQAKLLKFLDSMRFRRLGGTREITVELRVVAASNQDVESLVQAGKFREDLYHRLAVFVVNLPPLAARTEDIPDLARAFVSFFARRIRKPASSLSARALEILCSYEYPGNVRELRNIVERAVILSRTPEIGERDIVLPDRGETLSASRPFFSMPALGNGPPPSLEDLEQAYLRRVLEHFDGHRTAAAQAMGLSYPTFLKRLRDRGLD